MPEQIHGHEVMRMMVESGEAYSRASLREAIARRFGSETRFYTCSAENMTPDRLIDFLAERGKFVDSGEGFNTARDKICDHG